MIKNFFLYANQVLMPEIELNRISTTEYEVVALNEVTDVDLQFEDDTNTNTVTTVSTVTLPYTYDITTDYSSSDVLRVRASLQSTATYQDWVIDNKARYVKEWNSKNSGNGYTYWRTIEILQNGIDIALGKSGTMSSTFSGRPIENATDNDMATFAGTNAVGATPTQWIEVDLGSIQTIDTINIYNFGTPRTVDERFCEVSKDGVFYVEIYRDFNQEDALAKTFRL